VGLEQSIHIVHTHALTIRVDVFNFLNLLDRNWGYIYEGSASGAQTLLFSPSTGSRTTNPLNAGGIPIVTFNSLNNPTKVFDPVQSNWQMQLGVRYDF
jgi:hypothetical protein